MASSPKIIRTPKAYYQTRRTQGHSDWSFAFWRELFQNEVDAGADTIRIKIEDAKGRGSFGRGATVDDVVRVTFEGNGKGMNADVLENVFFSPGESTKRDGNDIGGFGTARLMLCFSQVRYAVRTQDMIVEGDGAEYTSQTVAEALSERSADLASLEDRLNGFSVPPTDAELTEPRKRYDAAIHDVEVLKKEAAEGFFEGCRFEIDIDPNESGNPYRDVDKAKLFAKLENYLSMSQLPCKVFVNGEQMEAKSARGPAKRKLSANMGGRMVDFATVHTSQGDKARHKGKVMVRVRGAVMYAEETSSTHQVIVEIDPNVAKQVLTDNRDGMKYEFGRVLQGFLEQLATDTKSALKDRDREKFIDVKGGLGSRSLEVAAIISKMDFSKRGGENGHRTRELPSANYINPADYKEHGYHGVPKEVVEAFLDSAVSGNATFLDAFESEGDVRQFLDTAKDGRNADALRDAPPQLAAFISGNLTDRMSEAGLVSEAVKSARRADMHDIVIHLSGDASEDDKIKNAVRRHHPNYWRREGQPLQGRGMEAAMLLGVWGVACKYAMKALLSDRPKIAGSTGQIKWATGWVFDKRRPWENHRAAAEYIHQNDVHNLLLNPILEDYTSAYDLRKERRLDGSDPVGALQDIDASAIHEAAHVMHSRHDEEYANVQTTIEGLYDRASARKEMAEVVDVIRATFGRGKARIQAMEATELAVPMGAEEEVAKKRKKSDMPRPAERLLAHAIPITSMVVGTVQTEENVDFEAPALRSALPDAVTDLGDGVVEVDCDKLAALETGMAAAAKKDWVTTPLDLDALVGEIPVETSFEVQVAAPQPSAWDDAPLDLDALVGDASADVSVEIPLAPVLAAVARVPATGEGERPRRAAAPSNFDALLSQIGASVVKEMGVAPLISASSAPVPETSAIAVEEVREVEHVVADASSGRLERVRRKQASMVDLPPVVEDEALAGILGEEFDMADFEAPVPSPRR